MELMSELKGWLVQLSGEQSKLTEELATKEKELERTLKVTVCEWRSSQSPPRSPKPTRAS